MFIPALLNRMLIGPKPAATASAKALAAAMSATSTERCMARRPSAWISAAVASACAASFRGQKAMSAPSCANSNAVARPIPRDPPVTKAIWPCNFIATPPLRSRHVACDHSLNQGPPPMLIARTLPDLRDACTRLRRHAASLALVPTMGALHDGHRTLVRKAVASGAATVASVFVNPLQFGPNEDLSRYPRDEDGDLAALQAEGCALAWLPDLATMYPDGEATTVVVSGPAERWEGDARPGYFRG